LDWGKEIHLVNPVIVALQFQAAALEALALTRCILLSTAFHLLTHLLAKLPRITQEISKQTNRWK